MASILAGCPETARSPRSQNDSDASSSSPGDRPRPENASVDLPPREAGPPRREPADTVARERAEAKRLLAGLRGSVSARQLTSMADIRGYRLYRERRFQRAQVWFEAAVRTDPSYEYSRYNAARVASLLGEADRAQAHLNQLAQLETPLSRRLLSFSRRDPDLRPPVD
jgi:tetratricopeptide (TPR) repeat protein